MAAKVSPLCSVAGNSAVIDRGIEVVNFSGVANPRPRVGWMAKAPIDSSAGDTGVQRSLAPLPSELKEKELV